ncbi:MAG TPA: hypothetical protein VJU86_16840 [Pyrinomonadaceae bacterium]|nr:hypothetical protein [Pyrinomonadaceae bacterium]
MKHKRLKSNLIGFGFMILCVIGCSRLNNNTSKPESTPVSTNSPAAHSEPVTADIAGSYNATGTNPNGSPYRGTLEVIKRGEVFQFRWTAGQQYDGVGVQSGDVVAVAFTEGNDGKGCGVVSYRIMNDGELDGRWGYWGVDQSGDEKATRTGGSGLAGDYNTAGTNPDRKAYKGTVSIASKAGGYTLEWNDGSTGFGIERANNLSVGVGGAKCAFVAYEIKSDGTLDGVWGGYGSEQTGTEIARKKD